MNTRGRLTLRSPGSLGAAPTTGELPTAETYRTLAARGQLRTVPIEQITPDPRQPRRHFDEQSLHALAASIREAGILQPPLVRPADHALILIAGERRWRAAHLAGLTELQVIVRHGGAGALAALIENLQREDLNPIDEADAYAQSLATGNLSIAALAQRLGRSRPEISNTLRLRDLPDPVRDHLRHRRLSKAHGRALLTHPDPVTRIGLADQAAAEGWSVRDLTAALTQTSTAPSTPRTSRAAPTNWTRTQAARLSEAFACRAKVTKGGDGYRVTLTFPDAASVEALRP